MPGGPPASAKAARAAKDKALASDLPFSPDKPVKADGERPKNAKPGSISKIARLGLPPKPDMNMDFPDPEELALTPGKRIAALVRSILSADNLCKIRSTAAFDIIAEGVEIHDVDHDVTRKHYKIADIYAHNETGMRSAVDYRTVPHAWIDLIISDNGKGRIDAGVWQFHAINPGSALNEVPTFHLSMENFLMYMHYRISVQLPQEILA